MKYLYLAVLLLAGCASQPQVVKVPVSIPCEVKIPQQPALSYKPGSYSTVYPIVRDLMVDRELMLGYEAELLASLKACAK